MLFIIYEEGCGERICYFTTSLQKLESDFSTKKIHDNKRNSANFSECLRLLEVKC